MSAPAKWTDAAIKDLTFAILMSTNSGGINVNANWDKVTETMNAWGYNFTKSAMSQHWTKRVLKEFRERHPDTGSAQNTPKKPPRTPGKQRPPKTPGSSARGKKRAAEDDKDDSPEGGYIKDPIARNKTPRSSVKKAKYANASDAEEDEEEQAELDDVQAKVEALDDDFGV
ncbi:hypothetical protein M406DRAFT_351250 [Cryphonectria parasitica EP155]|uniref:Uncharacterized protein n=1 Tax=Cryphonectria parasitica (strain ATCC 38755 / EP155) TaxID=660469 RepID=A0A9P4Y3Q6_CRYP1|nr:uncharacterized protein M406DRAFT_351250 [Cryphonectria parasitica EP155]KAF3765959.1 hypothetical protein M406DRAFT_351250 [Cryphonectria parasitica EP155]